MLERYVGQYVRVCLDKEAIARSVVPDIFYGKITGFDTNFIELSFWSNDSGIFGTRDILRGIGGELDRPFYDSGKSVSSVEAIELHENENHSRPTLLNQRTIVSIENLLP